jgi:hypothetical protein
LSPSFPESSSSFRPFQFLSEDLSGHPIVLHSLQVTQPTDPLPLYPFYYILSFTQLFCRSQCPRGLRRRSAAASLLRSWARIPPGAWMFFCCECCVLSGRGLCDELITLPEESYRLWCVVVCDLESSKMGRP